MAGFERLSPALQYQVVNALGWSGLRPVQELATDAILDGDNVVVLAPTAGGKTEAALLPVLSLMDEHGWSGPSVLYIAPIRALLNNQEPRLERLAAMVGRRAFKWHGDVGTSARRRFERDPGDVLSITPESLEAMLIGARGAAVSLLGNVRAVIIDEVHAFASGDRGAHLVALLERIARIAQRDLQRIGLSATVGDPEHICAWLSGSSRRGSRVVDPGGNRTPPMLALDFVGTLANAATMIERLYPATRRLVFVDSRRRVEELADQLAQRKVNVFVSHSSLSAAERAAAERAFEEGQDCVIVATSALELGIDVGDLDHVLQLDAPGTVSGFLQRMGRTGRRPGTAPNCTFLTTTADATVQAAALIRLRERGFVEDSAPSPRAVHVLAHQILALCLADRGVEADRWWTRLHGAAAFAEVSDAERAALLATMLNRDIIADVGGRLVLGDEGQRLYGRRNFQELYAVFSVPRVLTVMHGPREVGAVDAWFVQQSDTWPLRFVLAGSAWEATAIDWKGGIIAAKPATEGGYPRWNGQPVMLSRPLCRAIREVLTTDTEDPSWSKRARTEIARARGEHEFLRDGPAPMEDDGGELRWWTHAGGRANALLAALLRQELGEGVRANNFAVTFGKATGQSYAVVNEALRSIRAGGVTWERARGLAPVGGKRRMSKFQPCLPEELELDLVARIVFDVDGAVEALEAGRG
jgi:ATP-dependent Lhr-like helicase